MSTGVACDLVASFGNSGNLTLTDSSILYYYAFGSSGYNITLNHSPTTVQIDGGNNSFTLGDGHYLHYLSLGNGNDTVTTGDGPSWGVSMELVHLGGGANSLTTGSGSIQKIAAYGGSNTIVTNGWVGNINIGQADNTITTGAGHVVGIRVYDGDNTVTTGSGGVGTIQLTNGDNTITTGSGVVDSIQLGYGTNSVTTGGSVGQITSYSSINTIHVGGNGYGVEDMHLYGSNKELQTITIALWVDTLVCSSNTVADITLLGDGLVSYARTSHNNDQFDVANGFVGSLDLKNGDDLVLIEGGNANLIYGRGGNDTVKVTGYDGTQTYMFLGGDDYDLLTFAGSSSGVNVSDTGLAVRGFEKIIGTSQNDILSGGQNDIELLGLKGADTLIGGKGNDKLVGGKGFDKLEGGNGKDVLIGGLGNDTFIFEKVGHSRKGVLNRDKIADFASGFDKIDLGAIDADTSTLTNEAFLFSNGGPAANSVWIGSGGVVNADVNGDAKADLQIALAGGATAVETDFIL